MSASGKPENVSIESRDYWFKSERDTWALIEPADNGSAIVHFTNDESEHFGELVFISNEKALDALRRNEFIHFIEDKIAQRIYRPPSLPFRRIVRPNLLCSIFWTDVPVSEIDTLQKIAAMLKKYEPRFELEGAFVPGVRGRADPRFSETRAERFRLLAANKGDKPGMVSAAEASADVVDSYSEDGAEADPRINWRVTARHGDYYIHIMTLDQALSRFACCLQTTSEFEEGLKSYHRSGNTRYEAGNLAEIERVIADIYARFKREDEERRARLKREDEERRQHERISKAVAKEREKWERRLAEEENRRRVVYLVIFIAVVLVIFRGLI